MSLERRALLKFLAASPLFTALAPWSRALADEHLPASAADALDVFELEAVAQRLVRDAGFEPVVVGPLSRAHEFDVGTPVYTRLMTAPQLRQALGLK